MKKKTEPTYVITSKGVLNLEINYAGIIDAIMDSLELQARRQGCNAILINTQEWKFINVEIGK